MKKQIITNFNLNSKQPIYNWFYFTEAFSKDLVRNIFRKYLLNKNNPIIVDPFCGTGTTLLTAKEFGFESIGLDVSPLMILFSKAKTASYNLSTLKKQFFKIKKAFLINKDTYNLELKHKWIKKYFYTDNLKDLYLLLNIISKIKNIDVYFFLGVLIKTLQGVVKAEKRGSCLKQVKKKKIDVFTKFGNVFDRFLLDLTIIYKKQKKFQKQNLIAF